MCFRKRTTSLLGKRGGFSLGTTSRGEKTTATRLDSFARNQHHGVDTFRNPNFTPEKRWKPDEKIPGYSTKTTGVKMDVHEPVFPLKTAHHATSTSWKNWSHMSSDQNPGYECCIYEEL